MASGKDPEGDHPRTFRDAAVALGSFDAIAARFGARIEKARDDIGPVEWLELTWGTCRYQIERYPLQDTDPQRFTILLPDGIEDWRAAIAGIAGDLGIAREHYTLFEAYGDAGKPK